MKYIANSFSLGMLPEGASPVVTSLTLNQVREMIVDFGESSRRDYPPRLIVKSIVGHADIAGIIGGMLGVEIPMNRESISLCDGDILFVAQYIGPRLPEGTTVLPEGSQIKWLRVAVVSDVGEKIAHLACLRNAFGSGTDVLYSVAYGFWAMDIEE